MELVLNNPAKDATQAEAEEFIELPLTEGQDGKPSTPPSDDDEDDIEEDPPGGEDGNPDPPKN